MDQQADEGRLLEQETADTITLSEFVQKAIGKGFTELTLKAGTSTFKYYLYDPKFQERIMEDLRKME